jgi:hypothetical protein
MTQDDELKYQRKICELEMQLSMTSLSTPITLNKHTEINGVKFGPYEEVKGPPPPHVNQRCTMTPMENKMSEIKTETHLGKVYQIDQEYLFSNDGTHLFYGRLKAICPKSSYPFEAHDGKFSKYIGLIQDCKDQGTITPAPIELIDGAAYMFDYRASKDVIGIYSVCTETISSIGDDFVSKYCTNIRLMTVESK